ncbi:MAG: NADH-quinone oxidoreductase subunit D [Planctomycetes bacterium]|nr:NADH-quinone oxidoreductase subunit D [Planctomycetota bacterium]MCB9830648.1 NADH-quinone oxidoreductase subunit D [Planctomycetota bacterium]
MVLNIGPQHPATHGVLRVVIKTDGEIVRALQPHVGNLHRCAEKIGESVPYYQWVPYVDRMDYLAAMCNEHVACMAIEQLGDIQIPERAEYIRVIVAEVQRILSHLMAIGVYGLDLGAFTPFLHQFRERERGMDLLDHISGGRLLYHYVRIGGVKRDLSRDWLDELDAFLAAVEKRLPEYNLLLMENRIFQERTCGIGVIDRDTAVRWGVTGPGLRAAGVDWDLRRDAPYSVYDRFDFDVPHGESGIAGVLGDCFQRHWIRAKEVEQSVRIVRQALAQMPEGPVMANLPKSFRPAAGEVYVRGENPRGELACYFVSEGKDTAYRCRCRGPSYSNIAVITEVAEGVLIADLVALIGSMDIVLGEVDR